MQAAGRDVERAVESVGDGQFKDAGHDLSKAVGHTGDAIFGKETTGDKIGHKVDAATDYVKGAGHKVKGELHDAKAHVEQWSWKSFNRLFA